MSAHESTSFLRRRPAGLAVFACALAMGLPTIRGGFLAGDDEQLILNFVLVNRPSVRHAAALLSPSVHRDLYQPVPLLTFAAEFAVVRAFGIGRGEPSSFAWLFHANNVLLHAVAAWLVWRLVRRLHDDPAVAFLAAILFAVHPLAVEPVAWLSGRIVVLSAVLTLASLLAADRALDRPASVWPLAAVLLAVLAMASKVQAALPVLLLFLPLARRRRPPAAWWWMWGSCVLVAGGFAWLNVRLTQEAAWLDGAAQTLQGPRLARVLLALAWYFRHIVLPIGLGHFHPAPPMVAWSQPAVLAAAFLVAIVFAAAAFLQRRSPVVGVGLLWFLLLIAPTLPIVPSRNILAADRHAYLPNVGLFVAAAALAVARRRGGPPAAARRGRVAAAVVAAMCLMLSWHTAGFYRNDIALDTRHTALYPDHPGVWERLAWSLFRAGRYEDAIAAARRDMENHPAKMASRCAQVIGLAQSRLGRTDEAIRTLQTAVEADATDGRARWRLGQVYERAGRLDDALAEYRSAADQMPRHAPALTSLAQLLRRMDRVEEAVAAYERVLVANPSDPAAAAALAELRTAAAPRAADAFLAAGDVSGAARVLRDAAGRIACADADSRARMRAALTAYGEAHPEQPATYYLVARLLEADGDPATAGLAFGEFSARCRDDRHRQLAAALGFALPAATAPATRPAR